MNLEEFVRFGIPQMLSAPRGFRCEHEFVVCEGCYTVGCHDCNEFKNISPYQDRCLMCPECFEREKAAELNIYTEAA